METLRSRTADAPLRIRALSKVYANGFKANDSIDLEVGRREVVGLVGPNGAGKTTLIRQVLGLLAPTSGEVLVLGRRVPQEAERLRGRVGFVPQMPLQYPALTPLELVTAILRMRGMSKQQARTNANKHLSEVGLQTQQNCYGYQLSYGSVKLMNLAMALCQEPELLVLDEPTSMVDVVNRDLVRSLISSLDDCAVLLASHDLAEVQSVCDRSYVLAQGRVIAEGTSAKLSALVSGTTRLSITAPRGRGFVLEGLSPTICDGDMATYTCSSLSEAVSVLSAVLERQIPYDAVHLESPSFEDAIRQLLKDPQCE